MSVPPLFDPPIWSRHALLTCEEMRRAEDASCAHGPFDFYGLMQNAGRAVAEAAKDRLSPRRVLVLCGPGNNGGDGYVAAEALRREGWPIIAGAMETGKHPDAAAKAKAAWQGETRRLDLSLLDDAGAVIDALFGTGLQRPVAGETARFIDALNARQIPVIAADIPSGIDGDTGRVLGTAVKAQATVTFFRKKRGHVLLPGSTLCGEVIVAPTGMDDSALNGMTPSCAENDPAIWQHLLPLPDTSDHKYTRGNALVYGGAEMTGAARLAARAAQRTGAGLVTIGAPERTVPLYAAALESVIVRPSGTPNDWQSLLENPKTGAVLIGPGMGLDSGNKTLVLDALAAKKPCVLDADALTLFSGEAPTLFGALHPACVLTPHEGEFARLFGSRIDENEDKISKTVKAAALAGCAVLLKGADTVIANPEGYATVNHNAAPWLATAGSGDVLAGMILGLLANRLPPFTAAAAAAYLHGSIGSRFGPGLIAEDIVEGIPAALNHEAVRRAKSCLF